jgi:hypothetical protein
MLTAYAISFIQSYPIAVSVCRRWLVYWWFRSFHRWRTSLWLYSSSLWLHQKQPVLTALHRWIISADLLTGSVHPPSLTSHSLPNLPIQLITTLLMTNRQSSAHIAYVTISWYLTGAHAPPIPSSHRLRPIARIWPSWLHILGTSDIDLCRILLACRAVLLSNRRLYLARRL